MKLVIEEDASAALRAYLQQPVGRASCALARVEVLRAVRAEGAAALGRARQIVDELDLVGLDTELLDAAALLPVPVRSLDAIHLAAALTMGEDLSALVTYDERMARAASQLGLEVVTPV